MGSFGVPVAELFATLGLDSTQFTEGWQAATFTMEKEAAEVQVSMKELQATMAQMAAQMGISLKGSADAAIVLSTAMRGLQSQGASLAGSLRTVNLALNDLNRQEMVMAEIQGEVLRDLAVGDKLRAADLKAQAAEEAQIARARVEAEREAQASYTAFQREMLAQQEAAFVAEQMAEAEAARLGASTRVVILHQYLAAVRAAYAEELVAEEAMQARRIAQQGAYATGGYSAGRMAGLAGLVSAPVAVGVGAALSAYELTKFTSQASEAAVATRNLSQELGITFEQARKLEETARITGVSINTFRQASGRLAEALNGVGAQGKTVMAALQELGVEGSTSGEVMLDFLHKLSGITDQTKRIELAREVFSRSSYELVALASNAQHVEEVFRRLGPVMGDDSQRALTKTGEAVNTLGVEFDRLKQKAEPVGTFLIGWISGMVSGLSQMGDLFSNPLKSLWRQPTPPPKVGMNSLIAQEQAKANQDAAAQYRSGHAPTLEELRGQLNAAKVTESSTGAALGRGIDSLGPVERQQTLKDHDDAVALVADLQEKIKAMEYDTAEHRYALRAQDIKNQTQHDQDVVNLERAKAEAIAKIQKHTGDITFDEIDKERDAKLKANREDLAITERDIQERMNLEKGRNGGRIDSTLLGERHHAEMEAALKSVMITADAEAQKADIVRKNAAAQYALEKQLRAEDEAEQRAELAALHRADEKDRVDSENAAKRMEEYKRQRANDDLKARMEKEKGEADAAVRSLERIRENNKFQQAEGLITEKQRIDRDRSLDALEYQTKKTALESEVGLLVQMEARDGELDVHAASRKQTLLNQLAALKDEQAKRDAGYRQEEIRGLDSIEQAINKEVVARRQLASLTNANDRLIQLENERLKTWALTQQTQGLALAYKDVISIGVNGFKSLNREVASAVIGSKSFHDAWQSVIKGVGQSMVEFILTTFEKMGAAWVVQMLGIKAVTAATDINRVLGEAAVAGAAAYAATAAIPIIGPVLAGPAGMLAYSEVASTYVPLATFEQGGGVPHDMLSLVHGDEYVINRPLTKALTSAAESGGMGGDHFDFRGAYFGAGLTQSIVDNMMQRAIGKLRRGASLSTSSGRL